MSDNLAIIMVGLPATGKSFTSRNLFRYLRWLGINTFTFSAAKYRQDMFQGQQISADFFDASNSEFLEQRTHVADATLNDMIKWFQRDNHNLKVAIMDASNTIQERRKIIKSSLQSINVNVIFIECVYETEGLLNEHLQFLHLLSPDYENLLSEIAQEDYKQRIKYYRENYEPVDESDESFIKLINGGEQVIVNKVTGFLPIYDQSINQSDVINACKKLVAGCSPDTLVTWTAPDIVCPDNVEYKTQLCALNMANLEGFTHEEIAKIYPEEAVKHQKYPYKHRYPRCESYADLSRRLENVMMEMERVKENVLIIADLSVIRCIYSYFVEISNPNNIPMLKFNPKELIEFSPQAYGCFETRYIGIEASREKTFCPYLDHPPTKFSSPKIIPISNIFDNRTLVGVKMAAVEELHGVFQFTDDLFDDNQPAERILTIDPVYNPRVIYPCWFEKGIESIPSAHEAKNPIDTEEFLLSELYRRREYEKCLGLSKERIKKYFSTAGIVRDAAETAALCLLNLKRPEEALPLLPLMTGVEEPGRLIVRSRVYFECKSYKECVKECREYLRLRPGDYIISSRLAQSLLALGAPEDKEEIEKILEFVESTLKSYLDQTKTDKLHEKYLRDLDNLQKLK